MNVVQRGLLSVASLFVEHDVFIRFMILFAFGVGSASVPSVDSIFVQREYQPAFRILVGLMLVALPDAFVVAINHPKSRRSQLVVSGTVVLIVAIMIYGYLSASSRFVNASERLKDIKSAHP